jgi:predicted TIM-barrel fold metal-dependent hydrolase
VGIHLGEGFPGSPYTDGPLGARGYRARLSNPLLLEDALVRHPRLRVYVMHAGWPMIDEMINLLYAYPQVYADVSDIATFFPRKEFHNYLRRLVEAGYGQRLMFGSDQMVWPEVIGLAIDAIDSADFLSSEQKRDIFYNNAARFLRLETTK